MKRRRKRKMNELFCGNDDLVIAAVQTLQQLDTPKINESQVIDSIRSSHVVDFHAFTPSP